MHKPSLHRELQLVNLVDICEANARVNFRCATRATTIDNRSAYAHFFAQGTKCLRVAQRAALRIGM